MIAALSSPRGCGERLEFSTDGQTRRAASHWRSTVASRRGSHLAVTFTDSVPVPVLSTSDGNENPFLVHGEKR
ncbi:hypothetical protein STEG23_025510 [Scotinomys teguina]